MNENEEQARLAEIWREARAKQRRARLMAALFAALISVVSFLGYLHDHVPLRLVATFVALGVAILVALPALRPD